ncbi:hypothetical protein MRA01_62800 [Methylobacterium radiotolerans]|nr:hypothetical protein MRA01_62800 [Methylobacterium radiotolerans]
MEWIYRSFETSLLGLSMCLGLGAYLMLGSAHSPSGSLSVGLPMLTVTSATP